MICVSAKTAYRLRSKRNHAAQQSTKVQGNTIATVDVPLALAWANR